MRLAFLRFSDRQAFCGVSAVDPLVIDAWKLGTQDIVDHAVTPTSAGMGGFNYFASQFHIENAGLALMAIGISA